MHPKGYLEYTILSDEITRKLRYPHYIVAMKERYTMIIIMIVTGNTDGRHKLNKYK